MDENKAATSKEGLHAASDAFFTYLAVPLMAPEVITTTISIAFLAVWILAGGVIARH